MYIIYLPYISSNWNVGKVTSWSMAFKGAQSFNQNLANWDISKATQFYNMFEDTKSFNFKSELDVAWEAKNTNAYPGEDMFEGSCYDDPNCGKCGMRKTGGGTDSVVTCSSSALPAKPVNTQCTLCANDGAEVRLLIFFFLTFNSNSRC